MTQCIGTSCCASAGLSLTSIRISFSIASSSLRSDVNMNLSITSSLECKNSSHVQFISQIGITIGVDSGTFISVCVYCGFFFSPFSLSTDLIPNGKYICDRGEEEDEEEEEEEEEKERMWSLTKGREGDSFSCIQMMLNPTLSTLPSSHLLLLALLFPCYFLWEGYNAVCSLSVSLILLLYPYLSNFLFRL